MRGARSPDTYLRTVPARLLAARAEERLKAIAKWYRGGGLKDNADSRSKVKEVVSILSAPPRQMQLCAASLLARLVDGGEGTKQVLACGGLAPLIELWKQTQGAMWKSKGRIGALIDASLDVEHSRHAALYASQALAQLILHAEQHVEGEHTTGGRAQHAACNGRA